MAFDGAGVFLRLRSWIADATAGVKIRADFHDDEDNNFAAGLSQCITKDGQTTITQNIPFNSKRITALADPIDPQDAATKGYADTKAPLDGSAPFTGDVIIQSADGSNSIFGNKAGKHRWEIVLGNATAEGGSNAGSDFELINYADDGTLIGDVLFGNRATGLLTVKGDPTAALGIATKQYVLPITGGTVTGELVVATKYLRFGAAGGPGYIEWNSGGSYFLGGGGTIWHSGNFTPSSVLKAVRLTYIGDRETVYGGNPNPTLEPYTGAVVSTIWADSNRYGARYRLLQVSTDGVNYYTVGYAGI